MTLALFIYLALTFCAGFLVGNLVGYGVGYKGGAEAAGRAIVGYGKVLINAAQKRAEGAVDAARAAGTTDDVAN